MHIIGEGDNPILIIKKSEIKDLFSPLFYRIFSLWRAKHFGWGLPNNLNIDNINPFIMECLIGMDAHYRQEFSDGAITRKYLEAIIKRLDARGGI